MNSFSNLPASESSSPVVRCFELEFSHQLPLQILTGFPRRWADIFQLRNCPELRRQHCPCPEGRRRFNTLLFFFELSTQTFGVKIGSLGRSKSNKRFFLSAISALELHCAISHNKLVINLKSPPLFKQLLMNSYNQKNTL